MTVKEALEHNWQIGEKLWEVYYKFNKDITTHNGTFMTEQPVGIIEVEVVKIERTDPKYKWDWENISIDLKGDWGFKSIYDNPYSNTIISAMVTKTSNTCRYEKQKFCSDKFFNKEDAEKRFTKVVEQWNKKVKDFQKEQKIKLKEAKKQYEKLLNEGLINIENNIVKCK